MTPAEHSPTTCLPDGEPVPPWARSDLYDWDTATVNARAEEDLDFFRMAVAAAPPGPVVELGAGTGRVAVPLARAARRPVIAVDLDPAMLAGVDRKSRAARRHPTLALAGDMRSLPLAPASVAAVVVPYNSVQLLATDVDRVAALAEATRIMGPGARLALEVSDFQAGGAAPLPATTVWEADLTLGGRRCRVELVAEVDHDPATRVTHYRRRWLVEGPDLPGPTVWRDDLALRCLDLTEIGALLADAGLAVEATEAERYRLRVVARPAG